MTIAELRQKIVEKRSRMKAILDGAEKDGEIRDMSPDEVTEFQALKTAVASLTDRIAALEDMGDDPSATDESASAGERAAPAATVVRRTTPAIDPSGNGAPYAHTKVHSYSVLRALGAVAQMQPFDGLEREWAERKSEERKKPLGPYRTFIPYNFGNPKFVPQSRDMIRRNLTLSTGAGAIPVVTEGNLIDYLYNRTVVIQAGATVIDDMSTAFRLPRQDNMETVQWVTESTAATPSTINNDAVAFTPKTITGNITASRLYMKQATINAEQQVRRDMAKAVALGIDGGALVGTGTGMPLGVFNNPNCGSVTISANGGAPTWQALVGLESLVATQNADIGSLGYITNPKGRGTLKTTPRLGSTFPTFLIEGNNQANGTYPVYVTNLIPSTFSQGSANATLTAIAFGNWEDLTIALFDALEIVVDPFSLATSGDVRFACFQECDIHLKHDQSIATLLFTPNQ